MNLRPPRPEHGALPSCATFRFDIITKLAFCAVRYPSHKNNSLDCFCSAECYIPIYLVFISVAPLRCFLSKNDTQSFFSAESSCATFRFDIITKLAFCAVRYPSHKNNSLDCFCSAECYIPICFSFTSVAPLRCFLSKNDT